jgi:hypothetical protein
MVPSTVRFLGAALVLAAVGCCSTAPPKEIQIPVPVPCPAVTLPARPAVERCLPADTDAECAARAITSLVLLEGYTDKLEALLAAYAAKPPAPAPPAIP